MPIEERARGARGGSRCRGGSWTACPSPTPSAATWALDFCNTRAGWGDPAPKEYLTGSAASLVVWARSSTGARAVRAGLLGSGRRLAGGPRKRRSSRAPCALREALYACALHRGAPADWALVSAEAARARAAAVLVPVADGRPAAWRPDPALGPAATALNAVAAAAEDLLMTEHSCTDNVHTRRIAEFVAGVRYERIPAKVRERLKLLILNSLGCAIYGATLPWCRIVQDTFGKLDATRTTSVWGTGQRLSSTNAALVNGTEVQSFELDDVHRVGVLHVGAVTLPALFAVAESHRPRL